MPLELLMTWDPGEISDMVFFEGARPMSAGRLVPAESEFRILTYTAADEGTFDAGFFYELKFGTAPVGSAVWVRMYTMSPEGLTSPRVTLRAVVTV
jgi:hypothetical protein